MIERAELAIDVSGTGLSASDRRLVRAELDAARVRVLHAWSNREGVGLSVGAIEDESAEAESFLAVGGNIDVLGGHLPEHALDR